MASRTSGWGHQIKPPDQGAAEPPIAESQPAAAPIADQPPMDVAPRDRAQFDHKPAERTPADGSGERRSSSFNASRRLLRSIMAVVAQPLSPQDRLNKIVTLIASNLVAEVCSIYALRSGDVLELFASEGLAAEAVHNTRLALGEGLVGTIAANGQVINTDQALLHPSFAARPETREEQFNSFLGVPILRGGRAVGVLTVQNQARKSYADDEVEATEIIASVLAELFAHGGIVDAEQYADIEVLKPGPRRLEGTALVEGVAIGQAWLHNPKIEIASLVADEPAREIERLETAIHDLRASLDALLARPDLGGGEHREVLETFRMFADDAAWIRRIREAIETGLSAEAATKRVQEETKAKLGKASDPYLRERLQDLDDLANRLLLHLAGRDRAHDAHELPDDAVIVARNLSAADLIEFDRQKIRAIVLEEGSQTAHITIVARALGLPMIGRIKGAMDHFFDADPVALDAENGQIFLRPSDDVLQAFEASIQIRQDQEASLASLKDEPSVTQDGIAISLAINAAFLIDIQQIAATGADGCGLYRTELAFMTRSGLPNRASQTKLYRSIMDDAGGKPVIFRALDVGSDKELPYWRMPEEDNPAMGWRALRLLLDRPWVLRNQLRALIAACDGRPLWIMFPMVAEMSELLRAFEILDQELQRADDLGLNPPAKIYRGAMLEVPSLYWQMNALLSCVDFVSIGTNDLLQFLFACDRGNPQLSDRYDVLSPPALGFFNDVVEKCRERGVRLSVCGEMASRPLEAMALIGLGVRNLSLSPAELGSVRAMVRTLEAGRLHRYLSSLLDLPDHSLRGRLHAYARDHNVALPVQLYRPV